MVLTQQYFPRNATFVIPTVNNQKHHPKTFSDIYNECTTVVCYIKIVFTIITLRRLILFLV